LGDPGQLLEAAIADDDPVLFVEHKLLYTRERLEPGQGDLIDFEIKWSAGDYPDFVLTIPNSTPQFSLATYGYNFELARAAVLELLLEHEIFAEIVLFSQLSPLNMDPLLESLRRTHKLLTVEEGTRSLGWGAEVTAASACAVDGLRARRVAALDFPIANSKSLEDTILPSVQNIVQTALSLVS